MQNESKMSALRNAASGERAGLHGQKGIFDALLDGLDRGKLSDDGRLRTYVAGLAAATDGENEYERVSLEHQALGELGDVLARKK